MSAEIIDLALERRRRELEQLSRLAAAVLAALFVYWLAGRS